MVTTEKRRHYPALRLRQKRRVARIQIFTAQATAELAAYLNRTTHLPVRYRMAIPFDLTEPECNALIAQLTAVVPSYPDTRTVLGISIHSWIDVQIRKESSRDRQTTW